MEELKLREAKIIEYMKKEISEKGFPPTVREICNALNIKSTSTVHKDLENLQQKGFIRRDPAKPRAIMVVDSEKLSGEESGTGCASKDYIKEADRTDVIDIPLVGRIAAGTPILADQNIEDSFPVPARFVGKNNNFMLTVRGESMVEAGIFDGDYILVEESNTARNGEIVVAMIDGFESEATVKTFYHEGDHVRLQPENSSMSPIIVKDVKILGKVKGVFRYL